MKGTIIELSTYALERKQMADSTDLKVNQETTKDGELVTTKVHTNYK